MKNIFTLLFIMPFSVFAQDTIKQLSGETIVGKVIANKQHFIEFTYPNETSINTLPKALVESIAYSSGRKEEISKVVSTSGETGWNNVLIAVTTDEIAGLVRLGEVKAKADNSFNMGDVKNADAKATERLKKETVMLGGHVVLLLQNDTKGSSYAKGANSFKSGIAYGYPFKTIDSNLPYSGSLARRYYGVDKSDSKKANQSDVLGKKVLFENDGVITEGVIEKKIGNFYKIKWVRDNGKEATTERHISKVEVAAN